jgi:hypothetical protein
VKVCSTSPGDAVTDGVVTAQGHLPRTERARARLQSKTRPVRGEAQVGLPVGSVEYRDLVTQDEEFDVFGRRCPVEQCRPAEESDGDQVEQVYRHARDHAPRLERRSPQVTSLGRLWNPVLSATVMSRSRIRPFTAPGGAVSSGSRNGRAMPIPQVVPIPALNGGEPSTP